MARDRGRRGAARAGGQADLFGATGARYRGGPGRSQRVVPVVILRPGVLDEVERFVRVNQSSAGTSASFK